MEYHKHRLKAERRPCWLYVPIAALILLLVLFFGAATVEAQGPNTCVDDVTGRENNCTAADVKLGLLYNVNDIECVAGEMVSLTLRAELLAGSDERYDIGMFIASDSGDGFTGSCYHYNLPPPLSAGGTCSSSGDPCDAYSRPSSPAANRGPRNRSLHQSSPTSGGRLL